MTTKVFHKNFKKIFLEISRHTITLYLLAALILVMSVDRRMAYLQRLHKVTYWSDYVIEDTKQEGKANKEKLRRSIIYYKLTTKIFPYQGRAYGMIGYCYYRIGDSPKSILAYQEAIKRNPDYFWFYYNLGIIYFQSGDYALATQYLNKALSSDVQQMAKIATLSTLGKMDKKTRTEFYKMAQSFAIKTHFKIQKMLAHSKTQTPLSPDVHLRPVFHPWAQFIHVGKEILYSNRPVKPRY